MVDVAINPRNLGIKNDHVMEFIKKKLDTTIDGPFGKFYDSIHYLYKKYYINILDLNKVDAVTGNLIVFDKNY
jgi:hypothetical protein